MSIKEFTKRGTPLLYKFPALAMLIRLTLYNFFLQFTHSNNILFRNFATKKMTNSDEISISLLVEFLHNAESFENFKEIINNDEKLADVVLQTGYLGVVKPYIDQNNSDEYKIFRNAYFYNQM